MKEVVNEDGVEKEIIPDGSSYIDENGNKIEVNADHSGLISFGIWVPKCESIWTS